MDPTTHEAINTRGQEAQESSMFGEELDPKGSLQQAAEQLFNDSSMPTFEDAWRYISRANKESKIMPIIEETKQLLESRVDLSERKTKIKELRKRALEVWDKIEID